MIEIDGSYGEGGGQILRTTLALAAILQKEIRIIRIRHGRPVPGMKAQHLVGAEAVARICSAKVEGLHTGSTELVFRPGPLKCGNYKFDVGTAGSITLVLQTLMPVLPFLSGNSNIEITGGTDVKWSPPIDYLRLVILPILERMGYHAKLVVEKRGHYPRGGGHVLFTTHPSKQLHRIEGDKSNPIQTISGLSHCTGLPAHVASRQSESAKQILLQNNLPEPTIELETTERTSGQGPGSGIVLVANGGRNVILGADSLGERGVLAEKVGETAAMKLVEEIGSNAFLDNHMADIIVPYLVLASGVSNVTVSKVTQHLVTNVKVAELLSNVSFQPYGEIGKPGQLQVTGIGWSSEDVLVSATE